MKIRGDDLNDTIEAPVRPKPGALPELDGFKTLRTKHLDLLFLLDKANERREMAIAKLRRADDKVRDLRKAVARSSKRIAEARDAASKPNTMPDDPVFTRVQ